MQPEEIKIKDKKFLFIKWENGKESLIKLTNLKRACPCAACKKEREEQGPNYIPIYSDVEVTVKSIKLAGSYAITISWEDGHSTGIYEFETLEKLAGQEK